jgi:cytosine deaminase
VIAEVAAAGLHVVSLPAVNLFLQGRDSPQPAPRGVTRVRQLLEAGVNVAAASDNVRDPFYPFGDGDLLRLAALTVSVAHLGGHKGMETALAMVTGHAARAIGLTEPYAVCTGAPADLVVLDLHGPGDAAAVLSAQPARRLVLCRGVPSFLGGDHLAAVPR